MVDLPHVLAVLPGFIPSTLMQVVNPLLALEHNKLIKFRAKPEYLIGTRDINWANIVVFCRNTEPKYSNVLDYINKSKIPIIYDIDDNFFDLSLNNSLGRYHRAPERIEFFSKYVQSAYLVRVYSSVLKERLNTLNTNITLVTPPLNWSLIEEPKHQRNNSIIKLVYTTSRDEDLLWSIFLPSVLQIIQEYAYEVEITFCGYQPREVKGLRGVNHFPVIKNYNQFLKKFSQQGFDIGLAPLLDDEFHRSKTNNKFREYSACKISGIYSKISIYTDCIENGVTGLIVNNDPQSWYHAIHTLIENREIRTRIKEQAYMYARTHYSEELFQSVWLDQIQTVINHSIQNGFLVKILPLNNGNNRYTQSQYKLNIDKNIKKFFMWLLSKAMNRPAEFLSWISIHMYNFWMSLKINYLKKV